MRRFILIFLVFAVIACSVVGVLALTHRSSAAPTRLVSPDKRVSLSIPAGAMKPGTKVVFKPDPGATALMRTSRGVSPLGAPVDILVSGEVAPESAHITFTYGTLPAGVSPTNLGIGIFDPSLDTWVPLLDSRVDTAARTVTAVAPHFSVFALEFLDRAKELVSVGGHILQTVITASTSIAEWFTGIMKDLSVAFLDDFFGIAPDLACDPASDRLAVSVQSPLNKLKACAEGTAASSDTTIRLRNGYAVPLISTAALPDGLVLRSSDFGGDVVASLRQLSLAVVHRMAIPGAELGSFTATSALHGPVSVRFIPDQAAVGEDEVLAALILFGPEEKVAQEGVVEGVKELLRFGKVAAGKPDTVKEWLLQGLDTLNCVLSTHTNAVDSDLFSNESIAREAGIAKDCLSQLFARLHLESALLDILGEMKIIPEFIQSEIAQFAGPVATVLGVNTSISVAIKPVNTAAVLESYVGEWHIHGYNLTIDKYGTGTSFLNVGPCTSDFSDSSLCSEYTTLKFTAHADGSLTGVITQVWYADDGVPFSGVPVGAEESVGQSFRLSHNGPHLLRQAWGPRTNDLCDSFATTNGWWQCGA